MSTVNTHNKLTPLLLSLFFLCLPFVRASGDEQQDRACRAHHRQAPRGTDDVGTGHLRLFVVVVVFVPGGAAASAQPLPEHLPSTPPAHPTSQGQEVEEKEEEGQEWWWWWWSGHRWSVSHSAPGWVEMYTHVDLLLPWWFFKVSYTSHN